MKIQRKITILTRVITISLLVILTSCSLYTPSIAPPILIEKKGEFQFDGNISVSNNELLTPYGLHAAAAYCPKDNMFAQLSLSSTLGLATEFDFNLGQYINPTDLIKVGIFPGLNYGTVSFNETRGSLLNNMRINKWRGDYYTPYLKLQATSDTKYMKLGFGTKTGYYIPNINVNDLNYNDKALVVQPMVFIMPKIWNDRKWSNISINISYAKLFGSSEDFTFTENYDLFYNSLRIGIGFSYKMYSKKN
jgi:hypothetical protein